MERWTRATAASLAGLLALFQPIVGVAGAASAGGAPSQVTSSAPEGNADFDPRGLAALPQVKGAGDLVPTLRGVVLDGSGALSTSLMPRLRTPQDSTGRQVTYEVRSFAGKLLWSHVTTAGSAQVPLGPLRDGGSYTWTTTVDGVTSPAHLMEVDVQRLNAQRLVSYGGVSVTSVTGEAVFSTGTVAASALPGVAGAALVYQPSNGRSVDPTPGVPAGWRLETGAGWTRLQRYTPSRFELSDAKGRTITFTRTTSGVWVPRFGPGRTWPAGSWVTLADGAGGSEVAATDRSGMVTTFPMPSEATPITRATSSWSASEPGFTRAYDATGRLMSITDPVSDRSITLAYSGLADCPAPPSGGGFIAAPAGLLCSVTAWDGQRAEVAYSGTASAPRIARVTVQAQADPQLLGQTDLGYDAVGRLAAVRPAQVNRAVTAGVLTGFGAGNASDPRLLTTISYDARGRVSRIQRPSAMLSGSTAAPPARGERVFEYPAEGTLRVMVPGRTLPASTHIAAASTMLENESRDSVGRVTRQSWDVARQVVTAVTFPGGAVKRFQYDALGNVRSVIGPTTSPESPQAPRISYAYDTRPICPAPAAAAEAGIAGEQAAAISRRCTRRGKRTVSTRPSTPAPIPSNEVGARRVVAVTGPVSEPMNGTQTTYWGNRALAGGPVSHSTGPVTGSGVPKTLRFSWSGSPTGGDEWSARLLGFLSPPASGEYAFTTGNGAQLVVGGQACRPTCTLALDAAAPVPIRVDVVSPPSGAAGIDITWKGPGVNGPIPTAAIRPGYPMPTRVSLLDDLGSGLGEVESLYRFDAANPTQVVESVSPSGAIQTRQYEAFNPADQAFGRATTAQLAPGRVRSVSYYGGTETARPSDVCISRGFAATNASQAGAPRSASVTGGFATTVVADAAGREVSQQQSLGDATVTTACNAFDSAGNLVRSVIPGASAADDAEQTYLLNAGGNPLVTTTTSRTGSTTRTSTTILDLIGRVVSSTDAWGTTTVTSYDNLDRAIYNRSTTANGEATETRVTFTADGQIRTVTVDGHLLATAQYAESTGDLIGATYANGAKYEKGIGANLDPTSRQFTVGGVVMKETFRTAPSGRVLDRHFTAPGVAASWQYRYDRDSRLVKATLAGSTLPAGVKGGVFQYTFDAQSRRIRTVTPDRDVEFGYDDATGRMVATSDPRFGGGFAYDSRGRATTAGPLSLSYGVGGQVSTMEDAASGVTVANILDGSGVIGQTIAGPGGQGGTVHYSAQGLLLNADGSVASRMVSLPGGVTVQRFVSGASTWRYADGLGNVAWESDGSRAPKLTTLFDPDGNRLGAGTPPSLDPTRPDLGWAGGGGKVTSPTSVATISMGTRTYVPALATFLQPDPVPGAAPTPYAYVPDPINASDASGALPDWASAGIKAAVALVVAGVIMAKTAGTGAICAKMILQNMLAGALAGATGEAAAQGAAIGVDTAIDGEIEEYNEWSWNAVGIAAASGAGTEVGGAVLASLRASGAAGIQRAVDDAFDEAFSGLSATDDLISGAGLNVARRTKPAKKFLVDRHGSPLPIGADNHALTAKFNAPFTQKGGFKNKALEAIPEASVIDEFESHSVQGFGKRTGPLDNGFGESFVADDDLGMLISWN